MDGGRHEQRRLPRGISWNYGRLTGSKIKKEKKKSYTDNTNQITSLGVIFSRGHIHNASHGCFQPTSVSANLTNYTKAVKSQRDASKSRRRKRFVCSTELPAANSDFTV